MKVSIITVCYNAEDTIEDAIRSVLSQTYADIEYIIVDGESTDGTMDVVKKYENRIDKAISEPDQGWNDAVNKGIKLATGDIVGALNADDFYVHQEVISTVVNKMSKEEADCCWGDLVYVDKENPDEVVRYWKSSEYSSGKFQKGWMPPHPTFFVKKEIYAKYGLFDLDFQKVAGDYELMLRFLEKHRINSCYIPEVLVKMRTGGNSNRKLKQVLVGNIECYKAWKANGLEVSPLIIFLKPLSKITQFFRAYARR